MHSIVEPSVPGCLTQQLRSPFSFCLKRNWACPRRLVATVPFVATDSSADLHLAYTVVRDTLQYLFGGQLRGQGACVCQCPAAVSGECGALERLLSQQLAQRECDSPGISWHLHLFLGAAFLVIGIVLGVILGRLLGRRSKRVPAAIEAAPEAGAAADDSPAVLGLLRGSGRGRGRGVLISA